MTTHLLPREILSPPARAERHVAFIVGVASMGTALAGGWFRVEDGLLLRVIIAVSSFFLGALATTIGLDAKSAGSAFNRSFVVSIVFGMMTAVVPSVMMWAEHGVPIVACLIGAGVLGGFVGFLYGFVIGLACHLTWEHVRSRTHEGTDRAVRTTAIWALFPFAVSLFIARCDGRQELNTWATASERAAHQVAMPLGLLGAGLTLLVLGLSFVRAQGALVRRRRWIHRIEIGEVPRWSVRVIGPADDIASLPRLRNGSCVLEHEDHLSTYRSNATAAPVAIV